MKEFISYTSQLARRFREIILDGEWVVTTNYRAQLSDLTWQQATLKIGSFNTIASLTFHVDYYIAGVLNVFENGKLEISDKYSFDSPPIKSNEDWQKLLKKLWLDAEKIAREVEEMSDEKLNENFVDGKYGNYYRNINALIEHSYYHLGQIILIKKMIFEADKNG